LTLHTGDWFIHETHARFSCAREQSFGLYHRKKIILPAERNEIYQAVQEVNEQSVFERG
jgi:hypothetical protein